MAVILNPMQLTTKFKNNQSLLLSVLLVFGIIAFLNFFSDRFFWRADLTADKLYSTSDITKETLANLPDPVNVRIYFSKDLPNQFGLVRRQLDDLFSDYSVYGSNFHYQFIDPGDGAEADKLGIPKLQFNDIKHDKLQVVTGYLGMLITYRDKQEIIPVVDNTQALEYQLISLLKKLTADTQPTVGFLKNYSTVTLNKDLTILSKELRKIYQLEEIDLAKEVPANIHTLVIAAVKSDLKEEELKNLDHFLMSGRSLIVLQDGVNTVTTPVNFNLENKSNLNALLAKYGIVVGNQLVADIYNGTASFNQGLLTFNVNYPLWPKLLKANFSQTNPSVSQLDGVILPWATALSFDQTKLSPDALTTKLAQSSASAWALPGSTNVNPAEILRPTGEIKQFTLAASISGPIKSAYSNTKSQHSDLIVVADSDFIKDDFVKGAYGNLIFMQNLIDGVTLDSRLASIRSKDITTRSIKDQSDQQKQFITMFNIFGVTLLVAVLGALRYYWRKKSKTLEIKAYE